MIITIVVLGIVLALAGLTVLSHLAPFRFLLDTLSEDTMWGISQPAGSKMIYLTFDDGPNPTATPQLLDLLRDKRVHATFFLIDKYVGEATAPIIRRMFDEGHAVGQHSGDRWLMWHSPRALAKNLTETADRIESLVGKRPCRLFRPHAGWRSLSMLRGINRAGYKLVGWSWMMWDWVGFRERTGPRVAEHILEHAGPGKIAVIHDGHHKNPQADRRYAVEATRMIIERLAADGYTFGKLCD